jgi:hypothetical protein
VKVGWNRDTKPVLIRDPRFRDLEDKLDSLGDEIGTRPKEQTAAGTQGRHDGDGVVTGGSDLVQYNVVIRDGR